MGSGTTLKPRLRAQMSGHQTTGPFRLAETSYVESVRSIRNPPHERPPPSGRPTQHEKTGCITAWSPLHRRTKTRSRRRETSIIKCSKTNKQTNTTSLSQLLLLLRSSCPFFAFQRRPSRRTSTCSKMSPPEAHLRRAPVVRPIHTRTERMYQKTKYNLLTAVVDCTSLW